MQAAQSSQSILHARVPLQPGHSSPIPARDLHVVSRPSRPISRSLPPGRMLLVLRRLRVIRAKSEGRVLSWGPEKAVKCGDLPVVRDIPATTLLQEEISKELVRSVKTMSSM